MTPFFSALLTFFCLGVLFRVHTVEDRSPVTDPRCTQCGYSLTGLADDAVCPECGCPYSAAFRQVRRVERVALRAEAVPFLLLVISSFVVLELTKAPERLYAWGTIRSYLDDGYRLDVATNAAFKRELRDAGGEFPRWLVRWWFASAPLLVGLASARRRFIAFLSGAAAVLLFACCLGFTIV